jgi:hypothetical protein
MFSICVLFLCCFPLLFSLFPCVCVCLLALSLSVCLFVKTNTIKLHADGNITCNTRGFLYLPVKWISFPEVMGVFIPSTQRHYRRLILLLILLYCYMFRSYDHLQAEKYY